MHMNCSFSTRACTLILRIAQQGYRNVNTRCSLWIPNFAFSWFADALILNLINLIWISYFNSFEITVDGLITDNLLDDWKPLKVFYPNELLFPKLYLTKTLFLIAISKSEWLHPRFRMMHTFYEAILLSNIGRGQYYTCSV